MMMRTEFDPPAKLFDVALTFNPRPLEDHLHNVARDMLRFSRQIATLVDDVKLLKGTLAGFQNEMSETTDRLGKSAAGQETQLRVLQQSVGQTVAISQFNASTAQVRDQIKAIEMQLAKIEGPSGKKSMEVFERTVADYVAQWSKSVLEKDLDTRESRSQEFARHLIDKEVTALSEKLTGAVGQLGKDMKLFATHDQFRVLGEQIRDRLSHDRHEAEARLAEQTTSIVSARQETQESLGRMDRQIAAMYAQIAPFFDYDSSKPSPATAPGADVAAAVPTPRAGAEAAPMTPGTVFRAVDVDAALAGTQSAQTKHLLGSPAFVLFRSQIAQDINVRLGSAKREHVSESEEQMLDVRTEVRMRTTPERVVELIKQHEDKHTPAALAALEARVAALDQDKVSQHDYREGLRAKGDLHVVEQKADKFAVQESFGSLRSRVDELQATLTHQQNEREEFREILRDAVYTHRRGLAVGANAAATSDAAGSPPTGSPSAFGAQHKPANSLRGAPAVPDGGPTMRSAANSALGLPAIVGASNGIPSPPSGPPHTLVDPRGHQSAAVTSRSSSQLHGAAGRGSRNSEVGSVTARVTSRSEAALEHRQPSVIGLPPVQADVGRRPVSHASSGSPLTAAQQAYKDAIGSVPSPPNDGTRANASYSSALSRPGDRELLAMKTATTAGTTAGRREHPMSLTT